MKLEKREIMLNETDSVNDVKYIEKQLLSEYLETISLASRKETRKELIRMMREIAEDMWFMGDIAKDLEENSVK